MNVRNQPACGNQSPHKPHNGFAPETSGPRSEPWCKGVEDPNDYHPGDWVQVWGQVVGVGINGDVTVEFFSKTDQWQGLVREERVVKAAEPPVFADRCPALHSVLWIAHDVTTGTDVPRPMLVRCTRFENHRGDHEGQGFDDEPITWDEPVGYFEGA